MKKLIIILLCFFILGCSKTDARFEVESYLKKFQNHDENVISSLNELLSNENLDEEDKNLYELVMKRQYTDLEYKIKEEKYNADEAIITVLITVYDYENSKNLALEEINNHPDEYNTEEKKLNLVLKNMDKEEKRINYTLDFKVNYLDNQWQLAKPNTEILEKIHGIYDYEED